MNVFIKISCIIHIWHTCKFDCYIFFTFTPLGETHFRAPLSFGESNADVNKPVVSCCAIFMVHIERKKAGEKEKKKSHKFFR